MAKGGGWERDVCKFLSKWIQGEEKPYLFWRGRGSGGTFTRSDLVGESFAGDVYPVREEGKFLTDRFIIECKDGYKNASFDKHLKYNKSDDIRDFWIQTCEPTEDIKKHPMLIYKKKGMPTPWLGIDFCVYSLLKPYLEGLRFVHLKWGEDLRDTYFFEYKEFFATISPSIVKKEIQWDTN